MFVVAGLGLAGRVGAGHLAFVVQATFPTTAAGLRRARDWIGRGTEGELDGVLVVAEGTGSYGAVLEEGGYRVVEVPRPGASAAAGRLTPLDAVLAARSTLAMPLIMLRDRCAGEVQAALQVLTVARISSTPTGFGASTRSPL